MLVKSRNHKSRRKLTRLRHDSGKGKEVEKKEKACLFLVPVGLGFLVFLDEFLPVRRVRFISRMFK